MKRIVAIAACGLSLAGVLEHAELRCHSTCRGARRRPPCSSNPSRPARKRAPRLGQTCRTPCSLAVAANEFTVTLHAARATSRRPCRCGSSPRPRRRPKPVAGPAPRLVPNPVFVEFAGPPRPPRGARRRTAPTQAAPKPAAHSASRSATAQPSRRRAGARAGLALAAAAALAGLQSPMLFVASRRRLILRSLTPLHRLPKTHGRALSSAGERSLHTGEVVGSIPTAPTIFFNDLARLGLPLDPV